MTTQSFSVTANPKTKDDGVNNRLADQMNPVAMAGTIPDLNVVRVMPLQGKHHELLTGYANVLLYWNPSGPYPTRVLAGVPVTLGAIPTVGWIGSYELDELPRNQPENFNGYRLASARLNVFPSFVPLTMNFVNGTYEVVALSAPPNSALHVDPLTLSKLNTTSAMGSKSIHAGLSVCALASTVPRWHHSDVLADVTHVTDGLSMSMKSSNIGGVSTGPMTLDGNVADIAVWTATTVAGARWLRQGPIRCVADMMLIGPTNVPAYATLTFWYVTGAGLEAALITSRYNITHGINGATKELSLHIDEVFELQYPCSKMTLTVDLATAGIDDASSRFTFALYRMKDLTDNQHLFVNMQGLDVTVGYMIDIVANYEAIPAVSLTKLIEPAPIAINDDILDLIASHEFALRAGNFVLTDYKNADRLAEVAMSLDKGQVGRASFMGTLQRMFNWFRPVAKVLAPIIRPMVQPAISALRTLVPETGAFFDSVRGLTDFPQGSDSVVAGLVGRASMLSHAAPITRIHCLDVRPGELCNSCSLAIKERADGKLPDRIPVRFDDVLNIVGLKGGLPRFSKEVNEAVVKLHAMFDARFDQGWAKFSESNTPEYWGVGPKQVWGRASFQTSSSSSSSVSGVSISESKAPSVAESLQGLTAALLGAAGPRPYPRREVVDAASAASRDTWKPVDINASGLLSCGFGMFPVMVNEDAFSAMVAVTDRPIEGFNYVVLANDPKLFVSDNTDVSAREEVAGASLLRQQYRTEYVTFLSNRVTSVAEQSLGMATLCAMIRIPPKFVATGSVAHGFMEPADLAAKAKITGKALLLYATQRQHPDMLADLALDAGQLTSDLITKMGGLVPINGMAELMLVAAHTQVNEGFRSGLNTPEQIESRLREEAQQLDPSTDGAMIQSVTNFLNSLETARRLKASVNGGFLANPVALRRFIDRGQRQIDAVLNYTRAKRESVFAQTQHQAKLQEQGAVPVPMDTPFETEVSGWRYSTTPADFLRFLQQNHHFPDDLQVVDGKPRDPLMYAMRRPIQRLLDGKPLASDRKAYLSLVLNLGRKDLLKPLAVAHPRSSVIVPLADVFPDEKQRMPDGRMLDRKELLLEYEKAKTRIKRHSKKGGLPAAEQAFVDRSRGQPGAHFSNPELLAMLAPLPAAPVPQVAAPLARLSRYRPTTTSATSSSASSSASAPIQSARPSEGLLEETDLM